MKFGVFDHVDDSGRPLAQQLEDRLRIAEACDRLGFHCYHVAEHHGTPLGHAPSPSLLLAALSQRTGRILFGPLVYLLPLYHPLRLIEEVAMLDALSGGRLQLGVGRGISPIEMGFYGVGMEDQREVFAETLEVLLKGLSSDRLDHAGKHFAFSDVPMELRPVQQPHPPLWYGAGSPESVKWCARRGINIVTLALGDRAREVTDIYRREYAGAGHDPARLPLMGISKHIVIAASEKEALATARPAYVEWRRNLSILWEQRGAGFPLDHVFPREWDAAAVMGHGCAGTVEQVLAFVAGELQASGANYFLSRFAFGGMAPEAAIRSAQAFAHGVIPALKC